VIANLIFDLSGYGGSANFTAATTSYLINEINTLTGVTWLLEPADCKPKSNFYPGVPPVITTAYKVSFVDIDGDSTGFCNAGSLDFTKVNEIDLTAYGGSATTAIANNTDIVNAFAALSLAVSVSGCDLIIDNWNRTSVPSNVEVNKIVLGCTVNTIENGNLIMVLEDFWNPFGWTVLDGINVDSSGITVDWGDGNVNTYTSLPAAPNHTYASNAIYEVKVSYTTLNGDIVLYKSYININNPTWTTISATGQSMGSIELAPVTLDVTNCNNVLMTTSINNINGFPIWLLPVDIVITINGNTSTYNFSCPAYPCTIPINNMDIGNISTPGSYPLLIELVVGGGVTGSYSLTLNLS